MLFRTGRNGTPGTHRFRTAANKISASAPDVVEIFRMTRAGETDTLDFCFFGNLCGATSECILNSQTMRRQFFPQIAIDESLLTILLAFVSSDALQNGPNTTVTGITGGGLTWQLVQRSNAQLGTAEIWRAFADPAGSMIDQFEYDVSTWVGEQEIGNLKLHSPELWSPSAPNLYACEISLSTRHGRTSTTENFGFRYFEFTDYGPFKLNGKRLFLFAEAKPEGQQGSDGIQKLNEVL